MVVSPHLINLQSRDGSKGGRGGNPPPNVADWVGQILTELDHQKWPTLISCLIKEFELVKPQHWPTRVGHTSTLTDSSRSNLNIDRLESVKPQHWPSRVGQTSILTDSSWPNLNIDRLELVKPQHWPTRVGQTSTLTDSSWSNLNIDRLVSVKPQHRPTRVGQIFFYPPNHVPLEPSLLQRRYDERGMMLCYCLFTFIKSADSQKYFKQTRRLLKKKKKILEFFLNTLNANTFLIHFKK